METDYGSPGRDQRKPVPQAPSYPKCFPALGPYPVITEGVLWGHSVESQPGDQVA